MKAPLLVRTLSPIEQAKIEAGLRSSDAFTLRRSQILLASSRGQRPLSIARNLGCATQTVRNAIHAFEQKGEASLRQISKMQAGTLDYVEEEINLDEIINDVVTTTHQINPEYILNVHGLPSHDIIRGDRNKINQVFLNLMSNAIKYSPGVNIIDISIGAVQDAAFVRIQDYGIGIPLQHQEHIFERFYRVSTAKHSQVPGLGLGLSIAQEIVKHHRGTISVTSEEGKGSLFSVQLPLCGR